MRVAPIVLCPIGVRLCGLVDGRWIRPINGLFWKTDMIDV